MAHCISKMNFDVHSFYMLHLFYAADLQKFNQQLIPVPISFDRFWGIASHLAVDQKFVQRRFHLHKK